MAKFSDTSVGSDGANRTSISGSPEAGALEASLEADVRLVGSRYEKISDRVRLAGGSPPEVQTEFLKGLVDEPAEARKFVANPKQYCVEHGVLIDPLVVKDVTNALLFDVGVDRATIDRLGSRGAQAVLDMRANHGVAAVPAAVVAGAAVVAAAAAVVEAVVTVVRTSRLDDLVALKGLGPNGIKLPGGGAFRF